MALRSPHPKPCSKPLQPLRRTTRRRRRWRNLHHLGNLLQQDRPVQRIHLPVLPIPQSAVVELVRVVGFHERDGLLQFVEVLLQDRVLEGGDEGAEEGDVRGEGGDAVRIDFGDGGG